MSDNQRPKHVEITKKAIKSYLYIRPVKKVEIKLAKDEVEIKEQPIKLEPEVIVDKKIEQKVTEKEEKVAMKKQEQPTPIATSTTQVQPKSIELNSTQKSFSAYKQLDNLRSSINKKIMEKEIAQSQRFRSASVMHGEQIPVPHSNVQLSPEQEREKKITRMSNDISITKYDNGLCTIEREQFLGSPVPASSSAFACGESKFDKSFREHMKKVRDKIMPVKNK